MSISIIPRKPLMIVMIVFEFLSHLMTVTALTAIDQKMIENTKELKGVHLRVSASHNPPALIIEKRSNGTFGYKGTVFEMVEYLATSLKVTYAFINENSTEVELVGEIQANMNLALRKEVDIVSIGFSPSPERIVFLDFSTPLIVQPNRLVVPFPKEESRLLAPILPFQSMVWICLGICLTIVVLCLSYVSGFYRKNIEHAYNQNTNCCTINFVTLSNYSIYVVTIITNQGNKTQLQQLSFRILVATWCIMALVLVNAYSSTLISYLSVPKLQPIVNSLEELAAQKSLRLIVPAKTIMANRILESTSGSYKILGDSLRSYPDGLAKKYSQIPEVMTKMQHAYPAIDLLTHLLIFRDLKQSGRCRFTLSKPLSFFLPYSFAYPKNGLYTKVINQKLLEMVASGLVNHWLEDYMPRIDQCRLENQSKRVRQRSLTLADLPSAFAMLGLGVCLAFPVFILEKCHFKLKKSY